MMRTTFHNIIYSIITDIVNYRLFQSYHNDRINFQPDTIISSVLTQTSMTILLIHLEEIFAIGACNLKIILDVTTFEELTQFTQDLMQINPQCCLTQRRFIQSIR